MHSGFALIRESIQDRIKKIISLLFLLFLLLLILVTDNAIASHIPENVNGTDPVVADANSLKMVWIVGDSLTRGLFSSTEATAYRNLLFAALREQHPGQVHTTFWDGVCTYAGLAEQWDSWEGQPDLLFIELGINDMGRASDCLQVPIEDWQSSVGILFDRIQQDAPDAKVIVGNIPWSGWPPESAEYQGAQQYNQWIRIEAERRAIFVSDLWSATIGQEDGLSTPDQISVFPPLFRGDNFHPNDRGHERIANAFFDSYLNSLHWQYLPWVMLPSTS